MDRIHVLHSIVLVFALAYSLNVWPDVLEGGLLSAAAAASVAVLVADDRHLLDELEALQDVCDVVQPPDPRLHHRLLLRAVDHARSQLQVQLRVLLNSCVDNPCLVRNIYHCSLDCSKLNLSLFF